MQRILIIILLLLGANVSGYATKEMGDSITFALRLQERYQLRYNFLKTFTDNPSIRHYCADTDLAAFGITYNWMHQSRALYPSKGDGYRGLSFNADAYKKLSDHKLVWGDASYDKGINKGVRWNSIAHYDRLYPYIIGNNVVGDVKREEYAFSGGYAQQYKWGSWGIEMSYKAVHQYKTIDPRPRIITSDLLLNAGASITLGDKYDIAAMLSQGSYKQRAGFTFYDELGADPQYILSGLGNIFERFNESKLRIDYRSNTYKIGITLLPRMKQGVYINLDLASTKLQRILTSSNNVPINQYKETKGTVQLGYLGAIKNNQKWGIKAAADYLLRLGESNVIGDPSGGSYPIEASLPMFGMEHVTTSVSGYYQMQLSRWWWNFIPRVSHDMTHIAVAYPEQRVKNLALDYSISTSIGRRWYKNMAHIGIQLGYQQNLEGALDLPNLMIRKQLLEHLQEGYDQWVSNRIYLKLSPEFFYQISEHLGLAFNITYRVIQINTQNSSHELLSGIVLVF